MKRMKSTMLRTAMITVVMLTACLLTAFGGGPLKTLPSNDQPALLLPTTPPIPRNPITESAQTEVQLLPTDRTQAGPVGSAASDPPSPSEIREDKTMTVGHRLPKEDGLKPTPEPSGAADEKLVPSPAQKPLLPASGDRPKTTEVDPSAALVAAPGWNTVMSEGFEGIFPSGAWSAYDDDGTTNGEYFWDDTNYKPYSGFWSGWAARGGLNGVDPAIYYYPDNAQSWMVYGPFDLSDASDAELLFYYWNQSEVNYDWFGWYASTNGTDFYGSSVSGDSLGWNYVNFDLTAVPNLGNVTGDSSVWIAFIFTSDFSNVDDGPFVDNVVLQKYISSTQPNLTAYTPSGWDYPIVPSTSTGTHSVSTLSSDQNTYIDWAITNSGPTTSTTFVSCLYFDNSQLQCWDTNGITQNDYAYVEDWLLNLSPTAGSHTLKIVADVNNNVAESNEGDNTWQMSFTWTSSCPASSYSPQHISSLGLDGPSPLANDALPLPHYVMQRRVSETASLANDPRSNLPGRYNTSVFMTGKVAVGIILPESAGNGENWTTTEQNCVVQKIQKGLDWWKTRGGSTANLSFVYDTQLGIPTTYEPIDQDTSNEGLWIRQVLTNMGYTESDYWEQMYSYVNHLRDQNNADWAYVFIVADSSNDDDGKFPNGRFGYAYLGGPFVIMTYDNDGWGIADMNWVATHETGHIFMAADQYYQEGYGGCQSTTERYGYLGIANSNCEYNNPNSVPSIMRSNEDALENSARGQIGWQDSNGNGVFDPIDTTPGFNLPQQSPDPTTQTVLAYTGYVYDTPWPHASCGSSDQCAYEDITLQKITSVQYHVDGGSWLNVSPIDGALDSDFEQITFTTSSLSPGLHTIEVKASNSKGRSSTWVDQVTVNSSYPLTVSKAGAGSGTVTSLPAGINCGSDCSETYAYNTSVTLSAAPAANSSFAGWSGACSGMGACIVSMTTARSVTATFTIKNYALNVSRSGAGSGTVTSNPAGISCGSTCSYPFAYNTVITLTATATAPSTFGGWSGEGCSGMGTCTVTMSAVRNVTAIFNPPGNQTLMVNRVGTGTGTVISSPTGISCGSDCSETYAYNTVVTLTAAAATGSTFSGWSGGGCSGTGTCTVTMLAATTVNANFTSTATHNVAVYIHGLLQGSYAVPAQGSVRVDYTGMNDGPVKIQSTSATKIVASERVAYSPDGGSTWTSYSELMGLPANQVSSSYTFPWYNNADLNSQLRFGNVGNASTVVTVTIGGQLKGTYPLVPNQSTRASFKDLNAGPVKVTSSGNVPIIASLRVAYNDGTAWTSFSEMMGLPSSKLTTSYTFPFYNNVDLNSQLRFGNAGTATTTVTVRVAGQLQGNYILKPNESTRVSYKGLNNGPVVVTSSGNVPIIASMRVAYFNGTQWTEFSEMMGLPTSSLSTSYAFPIYDNVRHNTQIRFGNVGSATTTVTVTIGGIVRGTYTLAPNQSQRISYKDLDSGPTVITSSGGVKIIASERVAYYDGTAWTSYSEWMGIPKEQWDPVYWLPWYNNADLDTQLRFGVP